MYAIGYVRCALEDASAIERQRNELRRYCEARNWNLRRVYEDNGYSGMKTDCPGLSAALMDLGSDTVLLVSTPDRLSRRIDQLTRLKADIEERGARLYAARHGNNAIGIIEPAL